MFSCHVFHKSSEAIIDFWRKKILNTHSMLSMQFSLSMYFFKSSLGIFIALAANSFSTHLFLHLLFSIQTVAWIVAALVILINGYLLLDFFSSEVNGVFFTTVVCVFTTAYIAFIVYLIIRGISFSSWSGLLQSKRITDTGNWVYNSNLYQQPDYLSTSKKKKNMAEVN